VCVCVEELLEFWGHFSSFLLHMVDVVCLKWETNLGLQETKLLVSNCL